MINVTTTVLLMAFAWVYPRPIIREYLQLKDNECLGTSEIEQDYFTHFRIYRAAPFDCTMDTPSSGSDESIYLAIDSAGQVLSLLGQSHSSFEELVKRDPAEITIHNVYDYGWFIVRITRRDRTDQYFRLTDSESFFTENERLADDDDWGPPPRHKWDRVADEITRLCDTLPLDKISYNRKTKSYRIDYFIWYELGGDLERIDLSIGEDGSWKVITDSLVGSEIGYWTNLEY